MCRYFYELGYDDKKCPTTCGDSDESYISPMHTNTHMYAMGDKFGVKGLKALATLKFEAEYGAIKGAENALLALLPIIADFCNTTPENDHGQPAASINKPELQIMTMVPEFADDLLLQVAPKTENLYREMCKRCSSTDKWKPERVRCSCGWGENIS